MAPTWLLKARDPLLKVSPLPTSHLLHDSFWLGTWGELREEMECSASERQGSPQGFYEYAPDAF